MKRDHVGAGAGIQRTEIVLHGVERHEAAQVQIHVVAVADFLQGANTVKRTPFSRIVAPTAGRPGNRVRRTSSPMTITVRFCASSMGLIQRPFVDRQVANLVEDGGHSHDLAAGLEEITDRADVAAGDDRGSGADLGHSFRMSSIVAIGEVVLAQGGEAALHHGGAARTR